MHGRLLRPICGEGEESFCGIHGQRLGAELYKVKPFLISPLIVIFCKSHIFSMQDVKEGPTAIRPREEPPPYKEDEDNHTVEINSSAADRCAEKRRKEKKNGGSSISEQQKYQETFRPKGILTTIGNTVQGILRSFRPSPPSPQSQTTYYEWLVQIVSFQESYSDGDAYLRSPTYLQFDICTLDSPAQLPIDFPPRTLPSNGDVDSSVGSVRIENHFYRKNEKTWQRRIYFTEKTCSKCQAVFWPKACPACKTETGREMARWVISVVHSSLEHLATIDVETLFRTHVTRL
jgi:hypothetical protein